MGQPLAAPLRLTPTAFSPQSSLADPSLPAGGAAPGIASVYAQTPLHFEPNLGQTAAEVRYLAHGPGYRLFLTDTEAVLVLSGASRAHRDGPEHAAATMSQHRLAGYASQTHEASRGAVVRMRLEGAAREAEAQATGLERQPGVSNYYLGKDPANWRSGVPHYAKVRYEQVYPGIDLVYYGNPRQLEYDLVVAPGADPGQIRLIYQDVARRVGHRPLSSWATRTIPGSW